MATILFFDLSSGSAFEGLRRLLAGSGTFHLRHERAVSAEPEGVRAQLLISLAQAGLDAVLLGCKTDAMALATGLVRAVATLEVPVPFIVAFEVCNRSNLHVLRQAGANEFLLPPLDRPQVLSQLGRLLGLSKSEAPAARASKEKLGLEDFVGEDPALLRELGKIEQSAGCDLCTLLVGETGTGKELCARAIHYLSRRRLGPLVPVNCGTIPCELLENELFGHEPGAFTGAAVPSKGLIHEAAGGTLFLDEVDALSPLAQVKLLRFLQEGQFRRLGSQTTRIADLRVIAATNCDPGLAMEAGHLRRDFYYRLNALTIKLPPLRERQGDISLLAEHFARKCAKTVRKVVRLSPAALRALVAYPWPGNVRELESVITQAVLVSRRPVLQPEDLPLPKDSTGSGGRGFRESKVALVNHFEVNYLRNVLRSSGGNITRAAQIARLDRHTLRYLLHKHHIEPRDFGPHPPPSSSASPSPWPHPCS